MNIKIKHYFLWAVSLLLLSSCAYDNYDKPKSMLSGKIVYNGNPIHVASEQVTFRLFQSGFEAREPITVQIAPDGSYQALLFDGDYQIIFPKGQGPFIQNTKTDTLNVKVRGDTKQNIKVLPYYIIKNLQFSVSGRTVSVNFGLKQIIGESTRAQDIQSVSLYIGTTRFTNIQNNVALKTMSGSQISNMNSIHLSTTVPDLTPTQSQVYAHVAVKIQSVEDRLYSKKMKLQLK